MDIDTILTIVVIICAIASAIVGSTNPKADGFWWKFVRILNYISIFNPRGVKVMPWDEYNRLKDKKDHENHDD